MRLVHAILLGFAFFAGVEVSRWTGSVPLGCVFGVFAALVLCGLAHIIRTLQS